MEPKDRHWRAAEKGKDSENPARRERKRTRLVMDSSRGPPMVRGRWCELVELLSTLRWVSESDTRERARRSTVE